MVDTPGFISVQYKKTRSLPAAALCDDTCGELTEANAALSARALRLAQVELWAVCQSLIDVGGGAKAYSAGGDQPLVHTENGRLGMQLHALGKL